MQNVNFLNLERENKLQKKKKTGWFGSGIQRKEEFS